MLETCDGTSCSIIGSCPRRDVILSCWILHFHNWQFSQSLTATVNLENPARVLGILWRQYRVEKRLDAGMTEVRDRTEEAKRDLILRDTELDLDRRKGRLEGHRNGITERTDWRSVWVQRSPSNGASYKEERRRGIGDHNLIDVARKGVLMDAWYCSIPKGKREKLNTLFKARSYDKV